MITRRRTLVSLAALMALAGGLAPDHASAQERRLRRPPRGPAQAVKPPPPPMLAVVGLKEQRVRIYDSAGVQMLESSVSSGQDGYETPPGIFSVVQKEFEHHSNLYDDASMPYMQRLTWTGIALHSGVVPGYPASHGCVRLPHDFAERLFDLTKVGMRVVVAREGIAPVAIDEPKMFRRQGLLAQGDGMGGNVQLAGPMPESGLGGRPSPAAMQARVTALSNAAEEAGQRVRAERTAAGKAAAAAKPAERVVKLAEASLAKAEAALKSAERVIAGGAPKRRLAEAEAAKAAAPARIEAARAHLEKVKAEAKSKLDAARNAEEHAKAAEAAQARANEAAEQARQAMAPVSVLISRKTQRVYVRKAFHPILEGPVFIRDVDKPIGSFVFTANDPAEGSGEPRWSVVSLYKNPTSIEPRTPRAKSSKKSPPPELAVTDASAAQAALDRLDIPRDIAERIAEVVLPGSSLIITDEPPSIETGKDTDFVIVMSGEPAGGLTIREKPPSRDDDEKLLRTPAPRPSGGWFWFN